VVPAGETKKIKYFGNPTGVSISDSDVSFDNEAHEDAIAATKLQKGAEFERTDEFTALADAAEGRIRHDAAGLYYATGSGEGAWETVVFQVTDMASGDRGVLSIRRDRTSGNVTTAAYEKQWIGRDEKPEKIEINHLDLSGPTTFGAPEFETETIEVGSRSGAAPQGDGEGIDIFEGAEKIERIDNSGPEPKAWPPIPSWVPSFPSPDEVMDFFGDKLDTLSDYVDAGKETTAEIISGAVENAENATLDDIAIDSATMIVDSKEMAIELALEAENMLPSNKVAKFMWKIRPGFATSMVDLYESGALEEFASGDYGCAGCVGLISLTVSVGISGTATYVCAAAAFSTVGVAGIACVALFDVILQYGNTIFAPDAKENCSAIGEPFSLDPC
jgi:hypothetical protein